MLWHEHLRRTAKLILVGALHYSGLLSRARTARMKDRALILMYHRVSPRDRGVPDYSPNGMSVTPAEFEMQMQFLRRHYEVVPLSRLVAAVRGEQPFLPNMCAVTFDDGWHDVYEYAFPILKKHSIPATIYLTTGFIDGAQWFWEERSKYLLALVHQFTRPERCTVELVELARVQLKRFGLDDLLTVRSNWLPSYLSQHGRQIKQWSIGHRDECMQALEQLALQIAPDAPRPFMNWPEVKEMSKHNIDFGNHTITHPILPDLSDNEAATEMSTAKAKIQNHLGSAPENFAYPYGKFNEPVRRQVKQEGFYSASTTRLGLVASDSDPYALNRINMCSDICGIKPLFAARILGY